MKKRSYDILEIIKIFAESINKECPEELLDKISVGKEYEGIGKIQEFIINHTCKCMNVTRESVLGRKDRGLVTVARKICVILLKKHLEVNVGYICRIFDNRSRVIIHKIIAEYKTLNRANRLDYQNFYQYYDPIQRDVIIFINNLIDTKWQQRKK